MGKLRKLKWMVNNAIRRLDLPLALHDLAMQSFFDRIRTQANEPVDNTFLILFRVAFGGIIVWGLMKYFHHDQIWTCFLEPKIHFTYTNFDFIRPLPGNALYAVFFTIAVAATCILIGFRYRLAGIIYFLFFTYVFLLDQSWYLNHYYLVCLLGFLLPFLPADRAFSVDALRQPAIRSTTTPRWTLWMLRVQVGIPYVYGGIAKLNLDWLGGEPMRTWLSEKTDFPLVGRYFTEEWCVYLFSYGGLLIDLLGVPLLLWKRTRWAAMGFLLTFHLLNARLFNIGIFPWLMIVATVVLFLPPETIGRLRFWQQADGRSSIDSATPFRLSHPARWTLYVFIALQLIVPFRHFLYPASSSLTREGHCFSWRMKLNQRKMERKLNIHHADGRVEPLLESDWLTWEQETRFRNLSQILQLARFVREHHESLDRAPVSVKGRVTVSVNNNPSVLLVDDDVDLSRESPSIFPARWIQSHPSRQLTKGLAVGDSR